MNDVELLQRVLADALEDRVGLRSGGLEVTREELPLDAVRARLQDLSAPTGWVTTPSAVERVDGRPPAIEGRPLEADLHSAEGDVTVSVRARGDRYVVRTIRPVDGEGVVVTRSYLVEGAAGRLCFEQAWGVVPPRTAGDAGWGPLAGRFSGARGG